MAGYRRDRGAGFDAAMADRRARAPRRHRRAAAGSRSWRSGTGGFCRPRIIFRRRGIVVITSENFDGEWIAGIIERFGYGTARGSTSRGARKALLQLTREMARGRPGRLHASTARAVRHESRSPARSGWRRRQGIRCCRFISKPIATGRCAAGIARRFPSRSRPSRWLSASRSKCRPARVMRESNGRAASSSGGCTALEARAREIAWLLAQGRVRALEPKAEVERTL